MKKLVLAYLIAGIIFSLGFAASGYAGVRFLSIFSSATTAPIGPGGVNHK